MRRRPWNMADFLLEAGSEACYSVGSVRELTASMSLSKESIVATWRRIACLGVLFGWALIGPAQGAEFNLNLKADDIGLGDHVSGPKLTPADLKGKVVFIEFWGIQ